MGYVQKPYSEGQESAHEGRSFDSLGKVVPEDKVGTPEVEEAPEKEDPERF